MSDSVERFSNRVENYIKYRPDYPREIISYLNQEGVLHERSLVADIGCGPGISSRMFLENGNTVFGVEPNASMREAADQLLGGSEKFHIVSGTSTETTLPNDSVDVVTAAQAFHWFDPEPTRREFKRILKRGGQVVLMWNIRQLDTSPFLIEYEEFIKRYSSDYEIVRHENITTAEIASFFDKPFKSATFSNKQIFDLEGLKGRLLSSSYIPIEGHTEYENMIGELQAIFAKHERDGKIEVLYDTGIYHACL